MSQDEVVFGHTVEALLKTFGGALTEQARARLKSAGIDPGRTLPAYPFQAWVDGLRVISETMYPERTSRDAQFRLGALFIERYQEGFIGKAMFAMLRVLSARRIIDRMTRNFRTANNYTDARITDVGPGCVDVWFNVIEEGCGFTHGLLTRGLELAGVPDARVELAATEGRSAVFRITWGAPA